MNRIGQKVRPNKTFFYRPICIVDDSKGKKKQGKQDTLHIIKYPDSSGVYVWESEWPGRFQEL